MFPSSVLDPSSPRRAVSPLTPTQRPARAFERTFAPGTLLETDNGWHTVENLQPGDRVRTLRGMIALSQVRRQPPDRSQLHWHVPAGSLGNCSDMRLNAGQRVAILNPLCKHLFGDSLVLLPVPTVTGCFGVRTTAGFTLRCGIAIAFHEEEVVFAHTGSLLHVPGPQGAGRHRHLSYRESRILLAHLLQKLSGAPLFSAAMCR
ncbi:Hint domain-containing protein [Pseudodonghicola xiamenensis]|uniref:Hedgehog/Intein (Hint) domain-containing protein n=1 Tax=Pseudodonghicola xiamenensis TaxID=337702 RepID=A0A8J3H2E0_9RHOB|nr:Hint domain-containing protein [Pseudodonghicola xiamenensis]GHG79454.1 hypothetical protein GCM10010961_01520 [Pseudodonghicola xiamenensis]